MNNNNNANNMNMVMFTPMNGRRLKVMKRNAKKRSSFFRNENQEEVCLQHEAGKSELALIGLDSVRIFIHLEQNGSTFDVCKSFEEKSKKFDSQFEKMLLKKLAKGASVIATGSHPSCLA